MTGIVARSKVWLEVDGHPFLGDGRYRLLMAIDRTGSINAAARELDISYRKAWAQLQSMEESAPFPVLQRRTGGKNGGASHLTPEALELLNRFQKLRSRVNDDADRYFAEFFSVGESRC